MTAARETRLTNRGEQPEDTGPPSKAGTDAATSPTHALRTLVAADRPIWLDGVRAPRGGVARSGCVTKVLCLADDRLARTDSVFARVAIRADVSIVARRAVCLPWIGARAGARIAGAKGVTLVKGETSHGLGTNAHTPLASVSLRAAVPVVATGAVRSRRI